MAVLAVIAPAIPPAFATWMNGERASGALLSDAVAVMMLVLDGLSLVCPPATARPVSADRGWSVRTALVVL